LKLVNLTKGAFEEIAVEVKKFKTMGSTLYSYYTKSQETIIGKTSDVVKAKLAKTTTTRKNAIVEYLDYQIPVTQLKEPKGNGDIQAAKRD